jgi:hypothetical protein
MRQPVTWNEPNLWAGCSSGADNGSTPLILPASLSAPLAGTTVADCSTGHGQAGTSCRTRGDGGTCQGIYRISINKISYPVAVRAVLGSNTESQVRIPHNLWMYVLVYRIFLFTTASRTALGATQSAIQWIVGVVSLEVKRPGCEADHSPPSSAEIKECVDPYLHSSSTSSWRGA